MTAPRAAAILFGSIGVCAGILLSNSTSTVSGLATTHAWQGQQTPPPATPTPAQGQPPAGGRQGRGRIQVQPGQPCPPGTTLVRPGSCQAPGLPVPSILDYQPRSTLVTAEHLVPKAKFPVVDLHGHPRNLINTAEGLQTLVRSEEHTSELQSQSNLVCRL